MANLAAALLRHGRIQTTLPKAKALRPFVEKVITLAKKAHNAPKERALHYRRQALARVRDKEAVALLFNERAEEFLSRNGGYTRIYKLGNRLGDAADMAVIQLISAEDEGYPKKGRKTRKAAAESAAESKVAVPSAETEAVVEDSAAETASSSAEEPGEEEKKSS